MEGEVLNWEVIIPPNTTATVHVPAETNSRILEGNTRVEESPGVKIISRTQEIVVLRLQSGQYRFRVENPQN
jgi:alpha-L-rhamnosidase